MLKKIDKTRQEAEKVRKVKEKNNERLHQRMQVIQEEQSRLAQKRESIYTDKQSRHDKKIDYSVKKQVQVKETAN